MRALTSDRLQDISNYLISFLLLYLSSIFSFLAIVSFNREFCKVGVWIYPHRYRFQNSQRIMCNLMMLQDFIFSLRTIVAPTAFFSPWSLKEVLNTVCSSQFIQLVTVNSFFPELCWLCNTFEKRIFCHKIFLNINLFLRENVITVLSTSYCFNGSRQSYHQLSMWKERVGVNKHPLCCNGSRQLYHQFSMWKEKGQGEPAPTGWPKAKGTTRLPEGIRHKFFFEILFNFCAKFLIKSKVKVSRVWAGDLQVLRIKSETI